MGSKLRLKQDLLTLNVFLQTKLTVNVTTLATTAGAAESNRLQQGLMETPE